MTPFVSILRTACAALLLSIPASSQIRVVTSTTDLTEFVRAVGRDKVTVDHIVRGTQNPHYIELKPSYMMKLKSAQLFFVIGMRFEIWQQQIVDGSRNAGLTIVDCSEGIEKLEVPSARVDPGMGDVHPFGNPHYWLDPLNIRTIVNTIAAALASESPGDAAFFRSNADAYAGHIEAQMESWAERVRPFAGREIVTYHTTFTYFARRFGIVVAGYVEPKPGIPPTPLHIAQLMATMRERGIRIVGVEQYYEVNVPSRVAQGVGGQVIRLISSIGGSDDVVSYETLIDHNISVLERAFASGGDSE